MIYIWYSEVAAEVWHVEQIQNSKTWLLPNNESTIEKNMQVLAKISYEYK